MWHGVAASPVFCRIVFVFMHFFCFSTTTLHFCDAMADYKLVGIPPLEDVNFCDGCCVTPSQFVLVQDGHDPVYRCYVCARKLCKKQWLDDLLNATSDGIVDMSSVRFSRRICNNVERLCTRSLAAYNERPLMHERYRRTRLDKHGFEHMLDVYDKFRATTPAKLGPAMQDFYLRANRVIQFILRTANVRTCPECCTNLWPQVLPITGLEWECRCNPKTPYIITGPPMPAVPTIENQRPCTACGTSVPLGISPKTGTPWYVCPIKTCGTIQFPDNGKHRFKT
jgi:hypothetical protein